MERKEGYAAVKEEIIVFLFGEVEKTVMFGMASFEIVGDRFPIVDVSFEFPRFRDPRKAHHYKEGIPRTENRLYLT